MVSIYIDQNILVYLSEGKISLPKSDEYVWVYSDEHFAEIERSGKLDLLDSLDNIGSRRLKIVANDKFRITDEVRLEPFRKTSEVYNEYIVTIKESPKVNFDFISLLSFLSGNKDAVKLDDVAVNFESAIKGLMDVAFPDLNCDELKKGVTDNLVLIGRNFESVLVETSKDLKSIQEIRKTMAGIDMSNLDEAKDAIIDQIWEKINGKAPGVSKEQFFGIIPIPGADQYEVYPLFLKIVGCYTALNFLGYWPDKKMSKISKIYGINSDASHVGHAAFCSALLSEDLRLCKKASAIYQFLNINTNVCHIQVS